MSLSDQQKAIVGLPLDPLSVTACAGSGKTRTAVHRLAHMRRALNDDHGIVALLSFSNVAVDTFRRDYEILMRTSDPHRRSSAVEIDTVDGFITSNIIRPHAHRTLGCTRTPYLVEGSEPFLKGFTVFDGQRPRPMTDLRVTIDGDQFRFHVEDDNRQTIAIAAAIALKALAKLGQVGAYTHESGRYWTLQTLKGQPFVLRAFARRYPYILIDEAQDIGGMHQAVLELLVRAGSKLSLIGDPHQSIFDFADADGRFLANYGKRAGVTAQNLDINYRSVPAILNVANNLSGRTDKAHRTAPDHLSGAYCIPYKNKQKQKALDTYGSMLEGAQIDPALAVVLCRTAPSVKKWSGGEEAQGQGLVSILADAVINRDKLGRMHEAYRLACKAIVRLLADKHGDLAYRLSRSILTPQDILIRRAIWGFVRDAETGLPSGHLLAKTEWHPVLVKRVKTFLKQLETAFALAPAENLGNKLSKKKLKATPLIQATDFGSAAGNAFRTSTVHKVKGESIEAVMYVTSKEHVRAMLEGTGSELGRIGYVAVTRARNLFVLAVPDNCLGEFEPLLKAKGFEKPGGST